MKKEDPACTGNRVSADTIFFHPKNTADGVQPNDISKVYPVSVEAQHIPLLRATTVTAITRYIRGTTHTTCCMVAEQSRGRR